MFVNGEGYLLSEEMPDGATTTRFVVELYGMTPDAAHEVMRELLADDDSHLGYLIDRVTGTTYGNVRLVKE